MKGGEDGAEADWEWSMGEVVLLHRARGVNPAW
jgi:hypothetical protein